MEKIIFFIVLFHLVLGFGLIIYKLEFKNKKKEEAKQ